MYTNSIRKGANQTKRKHTRQSIRKRYILTSISGKEEETIKTSTHYYCVY